MKDNIGWLSISIPNLEGVRNPRPIVVEAAKLGKIAILHYVDPYGQSVCKKAKFYARAVNGYGENIAIQDVDNMTEKQKASYLPCPECYEVWKKESS